MKRIRTISIISIIIVTLFTLAGCPELFNNPPTISIDDQTVKEGDTLELNLNNYATDLDGDTLTYNLKSGVGSITDSTYAYNPGYDASGTYEVTIGVSDGRGGEAQDSFQIVVNNTIKISFANCLGGSRHDWTFSIQQTSEGGYIVAGYTLSNNSGDVTGNHGLSDCWIVKLDKTGNIQWQKCLGGSNADYAESIQKTSDGGYIVAGYTKSNDGDVTGYYGAGDYWIVKLDY
jgi:hypothetical protein